MPEPGDQRVHLTIPPPLLPAPTHLLPSAAKHRPQRRRADWRAVAAAGASVAVAVGAFTVARDITGIGGDDTSRGAVAIVEAESGDTRIGRPTVGPVDRVAVPAATTTTSRARAGMPTDAGAANDTDSSGAEASTATRTIDNDDPSPPSPSPQRPTESAATSPSPPAALQAEPEESAEPDESPEATTQSEPSDAPLEESSAQARVVELTNAERERHGCPSVSESSHLMDAAAGHAADMAARDYFSHTSPEGASASDRASARGYPGSGTSENIAIGHDSAEAVVTAWMSSDEHRAIILDCSRTAIGVGYDPGGVLADSADGSWVQMFGSP